MTQSAQAVESHDSARPGELAYHALVPESARAAGRAALVVVVHGISRNALEQMTAFARLAAERGHVLLAPRFDTPEDADYQRLGRRGRGRRADIALDAAIDRLAGTSKVHFDRRFLFGFSGGGQLVHRYLMAHPERVTAAVVAAAGWYTFPDAGQKYPLGLRVGGALAGVRMEPSEFLRVPIRVLVGSRDVERDDSVRISEKVDERQGETRLARAQSWVKALRAAARTRQISARHELVVLEGAGHSFADCVEAGLARSSFEFFDSIDPSARVAVGCDGPTDRNPIR